MFLYEFPIKFSFFESTTFQFCWHLMEVRKNLAQFISMETLIKNNNVKL